MIDQEKFKSILEDYKKNFLTRFDDPDGKRREKFKWEVVKTFQDNWDPGEDDFAEMFNRSISKDAFALINSNNPYAGSAIKNLVKTTPEETRKMFNDLFDETKDIYDRIKNFRDNSDILYKKYIDKQHKAHQTLTVTTIYLWLCYPDKYYIYKYGFGQDIETSLIGSNDLFTGNQNKRFKNFNDIYDEMRTYIKNDTDLIQRMNSNLTDDTCYKDPECVTLTIDIGYYIHEVYGKSNDDDESILKDMINYIFDNYVESRFKVKDRYDKDNQKPYADNPFGDYMRHNAPESLYEIDFLDSEKYITKGSIGQSQWADVCWVAIFDRRITTSASKGEYVVYLISKDGKSIYLSLAKAATGNNSDDLEKWARYVVNKMGQNKFECDTSKMNLGPDLSDPAENYIAGTAFYKEYKKGEQHDEAELEDDLQCMLDLYQDYIDIFRVDENGEIKDFQFDNDDVETVQYWLYSPGEKAKYWEEFYNDGIMALGWGKLGDLSEYVDTNEMQEKMKECYGYTSDKSHEHSANDTWQFVHELKPGDIVFAKKGRYKIVGRGVVSSDYEYDSSREYYNNVHQVKWTDKGEWDHPGQAAEKTLTNITSDTDYVEKLEALFDTEEEGVSAQQNMQSKKKVGTNILYYGVPGAGKSYTIDKEINRITERDHIEKDSVMERVVFHPEYTYSDFIGQILPQLVSDENKPDENKPDENKPDEKKLTYEFVPGPFTRILEKAVNDQDDNMYYLVIEEINRGNAPAIFGDIFQLLDRYDENDDEVISGDEPVGKSKYSITNADILDEINKNRGKDEKLKKVYIPSNLTIYATMNTSDQNVFTLDTAFQRRWDMQLVLNTFDDNDDKLLQETIEGTDITWEKFATTINDAFLSTASIVSSEDKRLGTHFVNESELKADKFPQKVLKYLWDDAFRMNRGTIFNDEMHSLEDIIIAYKKSEDDPLKAVLKKEIYNKMISPGSDTAEESTLSEDVDDETPNDDIE